MPAGPIGSVWALGSWSDTCWEANTWADIVPPPPVQPGYMKLISIGPSIELVADVVYALPSKAGIIHSTVELEISSDQIDWISLTDSNTVGVKVSGGFVRSPGSNATVVIKQLRPW